MPIWSSASSTTHLRVRVNERAHRPRRIGLARLRMMRRPLWILDEPLTGLDAAGCGLLARFLARQLSDGGVVVAATHQPLGIDADRVIALNMDPPE